MNERWKLAVLGGDLRQVYMAQRLAKLGHHVCVWGLGACRSEIAPARTEEHWEPAVARSQAVILPLPASADGVRVHCPLQSEDVFLRVPALLDAMGKRLLFGGRVSPALCGIAEQKGVRVTDYYDSELLQLKNALPTAEGALAIAMRELPVTLFGTHAMVLGYGRIGEILSERLRALGAKVTVCARRREALAKAELYGHRAVRLICNEGRTVPESIPKDTRVIFNTVPHPIFGKEELLRLSRRCVLIDLASPPGGIDHSAAEQLGLRSVWGTALPGKCTPESAGEILADTLEQLLSEAEMPQL